MVAALTEDGAIGAYADRKAALRVQILDAGADAATISLADKPAKVQGLAAKPRKRKLDHYRQTLRQAELRFGPSRLSVLLHEQLDRWPER